MLPVTPYFKASDTRIAGNCDDKHMLNKTSNLAFK
jgi:hypothetical protein